MRCWGLSLVAALITTHLCCFHREQGRSNTWSVATLQQTLKDPKTEVGVEGGSEINLRSISNFLVHNRGSLHFTRVTAKCPWTIRRMPNASRGVGVKKESRLDLVTYSDKKSRLCHARCVMFLDFVFINILMRISRYLSVALQSHVSDASQSLLQATMSRTGTKPCWCVECIKLGLQVGRRGRRRRGRRRPR